MKQALKLRQPLYGFTLIELLVVIAVIAVLMGISIPVLNRVRQRAQGTVCQSHLRQMGIAMKTYLGDHEQQFPYSETIYHSGISFSEELWPDYPPCCRWHDKRMGLGSTLYNSEHPELQGSLWPYIKTPKLVCPVGLKVNRERGCHNACPPPPVDRGCTHDPGIQVDPQYSYTMNTYLGCTLYTGLTKAGQVGEDIDERTIRRHKIIRETQVTRSPSKVLLFGEENSWAVNTTGGQPLLTKSNWAADFKIDCDHGRCTQSTLRKGGLGIKSTFSINDGVLELFQCYGGALATYHRAPGSDWNQGSSFVTFLDGHVERVTAADQIRQSQQISRLSPSRFGPGGVVSLIWPLDIPPLGGWENQ